MTGRAEHTTTHERQSLDSLVATEFTYLLYLAVIDMSCEGIFHNAALR